MRFPQTRGSEAHGDSPHVGARYVVAGLASVLPLTIGLLIADSILIDSDWCLPEPLQEPGRDFDRRPLYLSFAMADAELKNEKPSHIENGIDPRSDLSALSTEDAEFLTTFSESEGKRVIRKVSRNLGGASGRTNLIILPKVDLRLIPMLTLLYLISFLDRSNIGV